MIMKKLHYLSIALLLFAITTTKAQVSVDIHYGPPVWAPAAPVTAKYYYIPEVEAYYDVPARRYVYLNNGVWVREVSLPPRYRGYNLYNSHPVYLNGYRGNTPYVYYNRHKVKYEGNKKWKENGHDKGGRKGHGKGHH